MLYEIKKGSLEIAADTFGAELHSVKLDGKEYLWQCGDSWKRYAPILFPFICSPEGRTYTAKGKEYKMKANHGFARDMEFAFAGKGENYLSFELCDNAETLAQYPYKFSLKVTYIIEGNSVRVENLVTNRDDEKMYFYIGGHPAFNIPMNEGENFEDWHIEYESEEHITQKINGDTHVVLEYGNRLDLTRKLFDNDVILINYPNSKAVSLKSDKSSNSVTVKYPDSDCIAVWSPTGDDNAKFVCLEPWTSVPTYFDDDFVNLENKPNAKSIKPQESFLYSYEIQLS